MWYYSFSVKKIREREIVLVFYTYCGSVIDLLTTERQDLEGFMFQITRLLALNSVLHEIILVPVQLVIKN